MIELTRDVVLFYAGTHEGLSVSTDTAANRQLVALMTEEGLLEERRRVVEVPAVDPSSVDHPVCAWDLEEHRFEVVSYHLTERGHQAWISSVAIYS